MPNPTPGDVHVNAPLTNISVAYIQDAADFIADKVFPEIPVAHQSDVYFKYDQNDFFRDEAQPRAPGTESAGGGLKVTTDSYSCVVEAFHKDVDDQTRSNSDAPINMDRDATELVTQKMMIRKERRWSNAYFKSGVWGTDITPGTLWSAANSTPQKDVETGKNTVKLNTGFWPNTLVLGAQVFSALRTNAEIKEQFKYTSADSIDVNMLAGYFNVERILVASGVYATNVEGNATESYSFIQGKHALLCYVAPRPSLMLPSAGYTFTWTGFVGAAQGVRIKRFRMEPLESDRIEGQMAHDMKKVSAACGYFFASVVA